MTTADALTPDEERRVREAFEEIPYARLLGMELGELRRGAATLHLEARDELKRNRGILHGGVVASLADTAAAFAILTLAEPGQGSTTVDLTVHYLRPLATGRATACARVRTRASGAAGGATGACACAARARACAAAGSTGRRRRADAAAACSGAASVAGNLPRRGA